jgi:hypothetical protein
MKLEIHSMKDDLLEFELEDVKEYRPQLYIGGLDVNGDWQPWHATWKSLKLNKFIEEFEIIKDKILKFYTAEGQRNPQTGNTSRSPGWGKLTSDNEQWLIQNLKILNCEINDTDKSINLELMFDSVSYKNYKKEDKID